MVLASGNFGMVYLTDYVDRLSFEQINLIYTDLIPRLAKHEGIGFILINSEEHGPLVIGNNGTYYLDDDSIEGNNPLDNFGPNAADHIRRTNKFRYTPDVLINSLYDPEIMKWLRLKNWSVVMEELAENNHSPSYYTYQMEPRRRSCRC